LFLAPAQQRAGVIAEGVECGGSLWTVAEPEMGMGVERRCVVPDKGLIHLRLTNNYIRGKKIGVKTNNTKA